MASPTAIGQSLDLKGLSSDCHSKQENFVEVKEIISASHFACLQSLSLALTLVVAAKWSTDQTASTPWKAAKTWEQRSMLNCLAQQRKWGLLFASPAHFTERQEILR
jgi:hypothetical protein